MRVPFLFIRKIFPTRIWHQLLVILIILVLFPLILMGVVLIDSSKSLLKATILKNYNQIGVLISERINQKIEGIQRILEITSSILSRQTQIRLEEDEIILEVLKRYPLIKDILIFDLSAPGSFEKNGKGSIFLNNYKNILREIKIGPQKIKQFLVLKNKRSNLFMYVPFETVNHQSFGLLAVVDLQDIWLSLDGLKIGEKGSIFIVDKEGRIIARKNKRLFLETIGSKYPGTDYQIQQKISNSVEVVDSKGHLTNLVAYSPIGFLGWGVIIHQPIDEVYMDLVKMKMQSLWIISISIMFAILLSYILAFFIRRLIDNLIEGINKIAKGDYSYRFRIKRCDEIGKLYHSFNKMSDKLKSADKAEKLSVVGKAASRIAHELKNSLLLVNTFINMIPKKHTDKEFMSEFSETIPKELDYWNKMLKQMMDSSRPEKISMEYIDINGLLREIIILAKFGMKEKKIKIDVHLKSDMPPVFGNAEKLKQVFLNLLMNSIDATPQAGNIRIEMGYVDFDPGWTATFLEIKVSNSCDNLSVVDPSKVFDQFYTTKEKGSGLGLSICNEIVKQHGGVIEVESNNQKGISFSVQLPINKDLINRSS